MTIIINNTAPYSSLESIYYDALVAPAVYKMLSGFRQELSEKIIRASKVLDVGSGGGHTAIQLAESRRDCQITALDLSFLINKRAIKRSKKANVVINCIQGSALALPFDDNCFDVLYSVGSIRHWPKPALGLKECLRVLKPEGLLFVIGVNKRCKEADARNFTKTWRYPRPLKPLAGFAFKRFVADRSFTIEDANAIAEEAQIENTEIEPIPGTVVWILRGEKKS